MTANAIKQGPSESLTLPPFLVYGNNQGAIALAQNKEFHPCTKRINI